MPERSKQELKRWFKEMREFIREDDKLPGHVHYLLETDRKDEISARWEEYVKGLKYITDYYPWFCDVFSELYGRKHIVRVFFDDSLAWNINELKADYMKDLEAIVKYGFMGTSRGGVNGILTLRNDDKNNVGRKYKELVKSNFSRFKDSTIITAWMQSGRDFEGCKIVSHGTHGNRIVGLLRLWDDVDGGEKKKTCGDALFFDVWNYKR